MIAIMTAIIFSIIVGMLINVLGILVNQKLKSNRACFWWGWITGAIAIGVIICIQYLLMK